jgi:arginine deiminase
MVLTCDPSLQHDTITLCVQIADTEYDAMRNTLSSTTAEVHTLTVTAAESNKRLVAETVPHEVQRAELVLQRDTTVAELQSSMQTISTLQATTCYTVAYKHDAIQHHILIAVLGPVQTIC